MINKEKGYYKFYLIIEGYSNYRLYCQRDKKLPKNTLTKKLNTHSKLIEKYKNKSPDELRNWFENTFIPETIKEYNLKIMENNVIHLNPNIVDEFCGLKISK